MTRQVRISVGSEVYLKEELADNTKVATIYEVVEESVDRESNYEYYLQEIDNDEAEIVGPYYPESLVDAEEAQHPDSGFPSFKSYGLTREQVWEVMNNYANYMIGLLHDLEDEAISDGNEEFAKSFSDDKRVFYDLKLMSMIGLSHDLEDEAISDGNEEFAKSFSDDKRVFYDLKLMSDRLWHRFVEGD